MVYNQGKAGPEVVGIAAKESQTDKVYIKGIPKIAKLIGTFTDKRAYLNLIELDKIMGSLANKITINIIENTTGKEGNNKS